MEHYFAAMFEGVRHERSYILLLSLTDLDISKQSIFTDEEFCNIKKTGSTNIRPPKVIKR